MSKYWPLLRRRNTLEARSRIIQGTRQFFIDRGYLEVETPHRIPAPAPECHIDAIPSGDWFLHTSPEICMKRMVAAGYERIFQICRCWRDGERGSRHLPEFTLLEWYRSGADYFELMPECEEPIQHLASSLGLAGRVVFCGNEIDLSAPWERISVMEAFERYSQIEPAQAIASGSFDEVMVREIEPNLGTKKPTFIYDYPAERGSFARRKQGYPSLAERFELYIAGVELANAFSELIDPEEQRKRFLLENEARHHSGKRVYPLPEKFLSELVEIPPSAGIALGMDRLIMVLLDVPTIDEVVAFTPEDL